MKDVNRFVLPAVVGLMALALGLALGRYSASAPQKTTLSLASSVTGTSAATPFKPITIKLPSPPPEEAAPVKPAVSPLPKGEIVGAIRAALTKSGRQSYGAIARLTDSLGPENLPAALAFAQTLPKDEKSNMLLSVLVGKWAEFDPPAAIAYAQASTAPTSRNWLLNSAISAWADRDISAASTWVQQMPPGPLRDQALNTLISSLSEKDPPAALTFVQSLPTGRQRQNLYWPIFNRWSSTDPVSAASAAEHLPAGSTRDNAMQ